MTFEATKPQDREQIREKMNALRIIGGLLLIASLLLYFFHLAEAPMGRSTMGALSVLFAVAGVALLWVGQRRLRALR